MIILVFIFFVFTACAMDGMDSRLNVENQSPFPAKVVFECKNIDCLSCDSNKIYRDTMELDGQRVQFIRPGPHPMIFWEEYFEKVDEAFLKIHFWENAKKDTIIVIRKDILDSIRNDENWKIIIR